MRYKMSLKDYFTEGREAQKKHVQKKVIKSQPAKPKKLPPYDPRQVIKGLGVFYEMMYPKLSPLRKIYLNHIGATFATISKDFRALFTKKAKILKPDPEYEKYREFLDLVQGRK
jgi:hypothetical protein